MKRAEFLAWVSFGGLIVIGAILLAGGVIYDTNAFWAGMMVAFAQAIVVGLGAWGLMLARQREELRDMPAMGATRNTSNFRMSFGEENTAAASPAGDAVEVKTLETGFQRLVVGISAAVLIGMAAIITWMIYATTAWARLNPDKAFPIGGAFGKPIAVDELGLVVGLGAAAIYTILWITTRVRRETVGYGEAVNSTFTMGICGFIALGAATVLMYLKVSYASEIAAGILAALALLQGLELGVNALRSYSGIDELDQEAVDLQSLPLVPMLSSVWLNALKMLFAQSFGLSREQQTGVIGRMMPRAVVAIVLIAIAVSCLRVVKPGEVAVLERLGSAQKTADGQHLDLLQPGLHLTFPWPVDNLVRIPTSVLQPVSVGSELHSSAGMEKANFQFWTVRAPDETPAKDEESEFVTGDPGSPQMLETFVAILWRVGDPEAFYNHLSHSDFFEKGGNGTTALPVYDALVQQSAAFAVTRTFAIHTLDQIMLEDRGEVERHCKQILQDKLNEAKSGIIVEDLTIKDLHPPYGYPDQPDATSPEGVKRGPASAYENVVSMREYKERVIDQSKAYQVAKTNLAKGDAASEISKAQSYQYQTVATAQGEAARMTTIMEGHDGMTPAAQQFMENLAKTQTKYNSLKDAFGPVNKVVVDPSVKDVQMYQTTEQGMMQPRPPGS